MSPAPDPALLPAAVLDVLRALRSRGKQAFLAGGAVRDLLRLAGPCAHREPSPKPPSDFDVATDALPDEVQRLFPRTAPTGIAHGTITVLTRDGAGEHKIEVTTFRGEGPYQDGRRPSSVTFLGDIDGDLARRDFTVNAMAWDPLQPGLAGLRDPFGGVRDLERRILRAVGDPIARFAEDGLRPLRAVRFACTLRLALHPPTARAIASSLDTFARVAQERVRDELVKLLVRGAPASRGLRLLLRTGLLARIAPELTEGVGLAQNRWHAWDVWRHTLHCVDQAPADLVLRLAALLHDVGKPRSAAPAAGKPGENTFYKHELLGEELARTILERLRFPRREIDRVALLVREHNWHYLPEWTDATCRRVIARVSVAELPALYALRRADLRARGHAVEEGLQNQALLEERFGALLARPVALAVKDLAIGGKDLLGALALPPGPLVGRILAALLDRVLEDPSVNTRETLLRLASEALPAMSTGSPQGGT
ncbi:MAG: HD domain-containing protein [Myxococcales bacterium]